ncbi:hypothetical protein AVEN_79040-1 [Araneus ventricosus]|uniref:Uncharacterized protein n=1 Tax=Araneus ventricosus TaxID=182803 RepID=A0A4Y2SPQ4_ARAVE|nr:hypothetical protein AVEN_79040-1 [Araneus ventricosus]
MVGDCLDVIFVEDAPGSGDRGEDGMCKAAICFIVVPPVLPFSEQQLLQLISDCVLGDPQMHFNKAFGCSQFGCSVSCFITFYSNVGFNPGWGNTCAGCKSWKGEKTKMWAKKEGGTWEESGLHGAWLPKQQGFHHPKKLKRLTFLPSVWCSADTKLY